MLLNGHHLNGIVAVFLDTRQHVFSKFLIRSDLFGILCHSHVALIYQQRSLIGLEGLFLPHIRLFGVPHLSRENLGLVVLNHTTAPGGNTLALSTIPLHLHLVKLAVLQGFFAEFQLPVVSTCNTLATVFLVFLPVVEVTNQVDVGGIGCPLTEHPALGQLVKTVIQVTRSKVRECLLAILRQLTNLPKGMIVTSADSILERFQPGVVAYQSDMLGLLHFLHRFLGSGFLFCGGLFHRSLFCCSRCFLRCCHNLYLQFDNLQFTVLLIHALTLKMAFLISGTPAIQGA